MDFFPCFLRSCVTAALTASVISLRADNWPAWRGPLGTGISEEKNLALKWSPTENVKWRVALPEPGNSTPIVWDDRVFVTQAVGERRTLMCFHRAEGKLLWQEGITTRRKEPTHGTNPYCSPSPVTDGERVIVSFASDGLYCYDFSGKELWRRDDLGEQIHIWGGGVSPVIDGNLCFLNFGPGERTILIAVNKHTGRTVWQNPEPTGYRHPKEGEKPEQSNTYIGSWTTPVLMKVEGRDQLLMSWPRRLAAYDPQSGRELWTCSGLNPLVYTSPIYAEGIVVSMGGFNGMTIAVRPGGSGDITESRRLWHLPRTKQRIGSGVIHDGHIFIHNDPGVAECFELKTGKLVWEERLTGQGKSGVNWSSVLLAEGRCYTITQGGDCFVFKASPQFERLTVNSLGEPSNSSIAPSNGQLFIRTHRALWCIGKTP
ncbi:MAG: PQQ-like beta-propeller repeat protein [Verrucomicrobia bacterium]|nr:PQQ-like beta-propeller repeat protein [Verrucomicrobiota bacterium]